MRDTSFNLCALISSVASAKSSRPSQALNGSTKSHPNVWISSATFSASSMWGHICRIGREIFFEIYAARHRAKEPHVPSTWMISEVPAVFSSRAVIFSTVLSCPRSIQALYAKANDLTMIHSQCGRSKILHIIMVLYIFKITRDCSSLNSCTCIFTVLNW